MLGTRDCTSRGLFGFLLCLVFMSPPTTACAIAWPSTSGRGLWCGAVLGVLVAVGFAFLAVLARTKGFM